MHGSKFLIARLVIVSQAFVGPFIEAHIALLPCKREEVSAVKSNEIREQLAHQLIE
jgi:hypothetical protein